MEILPLQDLKVLDMSWVVAGPAVGRVLSDFGATVIRVETSNRVDTARLVGPYHNGEQGILNSACYENVNAGKLGLALDMSTEEATGIILDLVNWADVLIESFSPGVMKRWGLDYETLKEIKPELIMLSSSLMGSTGPYSKFAGYGNMGAAISGFQNIAGWPDLPPKGPFGPYTDFVGPRFALITLLGAVDFRDRTGKGCYIDVSQAEAGIHFFAPAMIDYFMEGKVTERNGNRDMHMAPHNVYPCMKTPEGYETWIAIAVRDDDDWRRLAFLMGGEELAKNERFSSLQKRMAVTAELDELIATWTIQKNANDLEQLLQEYNIAAHICVSSEEAYKDFQFNHREHFVELDHPLHNKTVVEGTRFKLSKTPGRVKRNAPLYGQDNDYILSEILNYNDEKIKLLNDKEIFK